MTMPSERTAAIVWTRAFLVRLSSPYMPDGCKRIPAAVRQEARRLLKHYPHTFDLAQGDTLCQEKATKLLDEVTP
jgi:hypothetical protein